MKNSAYSVVAAFLFLAGVAPAHAAYLDHYGTAYIDPVTYESYGPLYNEWEDFEPVDSSWHYEYTHPSTPDLDSVSDWIGNFDVINPYAERYYEDVMRRAAPPAPKTMEAGSDWPSWIGSSYYMSAPSMEMDMEYIPSDEEMDMLIEMFRGNGLDALENSHYSAPAVDEWPSWIGVPYYYY